MRNKRKNGFTLVELTVVLVIFAIIMAIASPFFIRYWKAAEFRKNESNARTAYLAAESKLTWYRSSGQWEQFKKEIEEKGIQTLNDRIYAITLDSKTYGTAEAADNPVLELLDDSSYDKETLDAAIAIEIDIESGEVYSAFYGTRCKGLTYASEDEDHYLTMRNRDYESRRERLLGYYSAEDTVNVVELDPIRLRIMTISLLNNEKLSLNWSSNVGSSKAVSYVITFYKDDDKSKLFSLTMSPYDMGTEGWNGESGSSTELTALTLTDQNGTDKGKWYFPVTYSDNKYSLVLDAMMSAKVMAALDATSGDTKTELEKTSSTSIRRLSAVAGDLANAQNIYATVKAVSYAGTVDASLGDFRNEYRDSEEVSSNTANTLYGDETEGTDVKINTFRHLSNIRYYGEYTPGTFSLETRNMDWTAVGTGLYDTIVTQNAVRSSLAWQESSEKEVDFPTVPKLSSYYQKLTGKGSRTLISNLRLGEESVISDKVAQTIGNGTKKSEYLGLFGEVDGTIENVTFKDPSLHLTSSAEVPFTALKGIGILTGRDGGNLTDITINVTKTAQELTDEEATVYVDLTSYGSNAHVGGIAGELVRRAATNGKYMVFNSLLNNVIMEGRVTALYATDGVTAVPAMPEEKNVNSIWNAGSVGGITGYAWMDNQTSAGKRIENCANHAAVSGTLFVGGIAGRVDGSFSYNSADDVQYQNAADILNCSNDGLVLSAVDAETSSLAGHYIGGITGYARSADIYGSTNASGRASSFTYDAGKSSLLKGWYVGGIVGYGEKSLISNCSTEKNGYVLGSDYVGGIAGGLGNEFGDAIRAEGEVTVTTNGNYVIGNRYVGGITGKNDKNVTLTNCINNGIAACYDKYAGGIVGYNENGATVKDCASYLSDYDNSIFNMIVNDWKTTGDYVGGIAGYNNGMILFTEGSEAITVKSVSSIVVGNSYVGGIAGFNDTKGDLDVHYTLIGGRIYGYEDAVGGCFGFNASESVLDHELVIKPRSVTGRYFVGGIIGANVVNLSASNVKMEQYRAENSLGSIQGDAFVGGLIGYQRTYEGGQIKEGTDGSIRQAVEDAQNASGTDRILPTLDSNYVPRQVMASTNKNTLTITTRDNQDGTFDTAANNIPIEAGAYAGGIVGYCEKDSYLVIRNCRNKGSLTFNTDFHSGNGINLAKFIRSNEVKRSTLPSDAEDINLSFAGGIIGVNLENQVIDHCVNTGTMSGFTGVGGVAGLNAGLIYNCSLNDNFGNGGLSYLGGIASVNIQSSLKDTRTYGDIRFTTGTIQNCSTARNKTVSGKDAVGGIVSWNLSGGVIRENISYANVSGAGDYIGGIAGRNSGVIEIAEASGDTVSRTVRSSRGSGVGGVIGKNESDGTLQINGNANKNGELTAISSSVTVTGYERVGGIVGINEGTLGTSGSTAKIASEAKQVRASHGYAGGVAGVTSGNLVNAVNRSEQVSADAGYAGGITALNESGKSITDCINYGPVRSSAGYAGGIVAENKGTVTSCTVQAEGTSTLVIYSRGVQEAGAVCAVNSGTIRKSTPSAGVQLQGTAKIYGGIVGKNVKGGVVTDTTMTQMPSISTSTSRLTVGGAVGQNDGTISQVETQDIAFEDFTNYQYLGGIAGTNGVENTGENGAQIINCTFSGTITEKSGAAGNCYGGIAGINNADLQNSSVGLIKLTVRGVYTATSTSTTEQKEALATHAGGITGKNETAGVISGCTLENRSDSEFVAQYGMLGGVAGFNKGLIEQSGSSITPDVVTTAVTSMTKKTERIQALNENAKNAGLKKDDTYITWNANAQIEDTVYDGGSTKVSDDRLKFYMNTNGNLGGITAYNSTTGQLTGCVSGNWFLANKSEALGVGTGGIIGMNESEKDLKYLVNGAFVGRQLKKGTDNRFAGGIIGNQNNSTSSDWTISDCINYGTVYCYNSHYSGGIMGQWTGTGGTIENCRNYGNLQTTHGADWIGASGGIVAQLYHAMENNEYDIISCTNYGNIYTKEGKKWDTMCGANDSAGILGNITTYRVNSVEQGNRFSVQILDCATAPGVEIYSSSMASGIFGFLSCDNASKYNIQISTANVDIRIERCRSFASALKGNNYYGGIFGDRYNTTAWRDHTIVKDNYALHLENDQYQSGQGGKGYPVYSFGIRDGNSGNIANAEDRRNNFYLQIEQDWVYTNLRIGEGADTVGQGSGLTGNGEYETGLSDRYVYAAYLMYDMTAKKYFVANMSNPAILVYADSKPADTWDYVYYGAGSGKFKGNYQMHGNSLYIASGGRILDKNGKLTGNVLDYIDTEATKSDQVINDPQNIVYENARTGWARLEGIYKVDNDEQKIQAPESVKADIVDGQVTVTIQAPKLRFSDGTSSTTEVSDPFAYEVEVSNGTQTSVHKIYAEDGSFTLPAGMTGTLTVRVRAVSMYDGVLESDWVAADTHVVSTILPDPDVRLELISDTGAENGHAYKVSLNNLDAYEQTDEDGNELYADWSVQVTIPGTRETSVILNRSNPEQNIHVYTNAASEIYQLTAQAFSTDTELQASGQVSTAITLHNYYRPPITLRGDWSPQMNTTVSVTGETLDDMSVTVKMDAGSTAMDTPPIFRVEILGTWNGEEIVFAKEEVLSVSAGEAEATFNVLPETIGEAENLRVRIWYAASGLGPVYTYHDVDLADEANIKEFAGQEDNGDPIWNYSYSSVVAEYGSDSDYNGYMGRYITTTGYILTWLPAPVLTGVDEVLVPEEKNGKLNYIFKWDQETTDGVSNSYHVSLTGIDANGEEVIITSDQKVVGNQFMIDGSDWNYQSVRLKVTRIGDSEVQPPQIGLSSEGTYLVKPRLESPEAPFATNADDNELLYTLSWSGIASETGCAGYQPYIQVYNETSSTWETAATLDDMVPVNASGVYNTSVNLEDYAGKRVQIYLVAKATADGGYLDSLEGVTYELNVPSRINTPKVTWSVDWQYDKNQPLSASDFKNNGLKVSLTANDTASIPPGGSAYLLRAYVYDTEEKANAATVTAPGNDIMKVYPASYEENGVPVQMDVTDSANYYHTLAGMDLKLAGKWIVFYARISAGSGSISSDWVKSQAFQLPYVKLDQPNFVSGSKDATITAKVESTPGVPAETRTWSATRTTLTWDSVDSADMYVLNLSGNAKTSSTDTEKTQIGTSIRILETDSGVEVAYQKDGEWTSIAQSSDGAYHISSYRVESTGSYQAAAGGAPAYTIEAEAELTVTRNEDNSYSYELLLPDMKNVTTHDGRSVSNENFSVTANATIRADVNGSSDAYVASDEKKAEW